MNVIFNKLREEDEETTKIKKDFCIIICIKQNVDKILAASGGGGVVARLSSLLPPPPSENVSFCFLFKLIHLSM